MKSQSRAAWAIHTQSPEGHGFVGRWYLRKWRASGGVPEQLSGYRTAVFDTREKAREALRLIKGPEWGFKRARIYRVMVTIEGEPA